MTVTLYCATAMLIRPWHTRVTVTKTTWTQISSLINFATGGLKPDLTLLLDVGAEAGLKRKAGRY